MGGLPPIADLLTVAAVLAEVGWALNLWRTGLYRRYPVLFAFLIVASLDSVASHIAYRHYAESVIYGWYWVVAQPLSWTLYFCLLVEVHNRMLSGFKGFERLGQLLIYAASGAVSMVFLGMMFLEVSRETWMQFWFLQRRSVYIGLTLFTMFLVVFGLYFHLKIPRNVKTLFGTFAILFGSVAMTLILADMWGEAIGSVQRPVMAASYLLCIGFGAATFSLAGEQQPQPIQLREPLDVEAEAQLTSGLENLNDMLLRILRP